MKSRVHPKYTTRYRVGNWPAYDRALVQRGDVTLWLTPDAVATWAAVASLSLLRINIAMRYTASLTATPTSSKYFSVKLRVWAEPQNQSE